MKQITFKQNRYFDQLRLINANILPKHHVKGTNFVKANYFTTQVYW